MCITSFWLAIPSTLTIANFEYAGGNVQESIAKTGIWDSRETEVAKEILQAGCLSNSSTSLMVDVGANTGYFSAMALAAGCSVVTFEPTSYHEPYIRLSAHANGNSDRLQIVQRLVSDTSGVDIPFDTWNIAETAKWMNTSQRSYKSKEVIRTIPSTRIDDIVTTDVLYMKIDVEGHEPAAFRGLTKLLSSKKVNLRLSICWIIRKHLFTFLHCLLIDYSVRFTIFYGKIHRIISLNLTNYAHRYKFSKNLGSLYLLSIMEEAGIM